MMTTTLLASFPSPGRGVWHLGPVPIRAYALCIIVGIIAALVIGDRRWAARGGERGVIYDIALWAVPFGLLGGRLYHLITDWRTYFGPTGVGADAALRIWDGGLGIWGAVALGAVGAWIGCRRRGIPLPAFGDAIAPGIVLAQAIGRLGNYFNQELYGRETTVPWGMEIFYRRDPSGILNEHSLDGVSTGQVFAVVQPTFLYELLWNVLIFVVLIYVDRRFKIGHGRLFALYVAGYCVGRFGIELLRSDPATLIDGIRVNSFTSTFVFIGAVVYIVLAPRGREDPDALRATWMTEEESEPDTERVAVPLAIAAGAVAGGDGADLEAGEAESADESDVEEFPTGAEEVVDEAAAAEEGEAEAEAVELAEAGEAAADEALVEASADDAEGGETVAAAAAEPVAEESPLTPRSRPSPKRPRNRQPKRAKPRPSTWSRRGKRPPRSPRLTPLRSPRSSPSLRRPRSRCPRKPTLRTSRRSTPKRRSLRSRRLRSPGSSLRASRCPKKPRPRLRTPRPSRLTRRLSRLLVMNPRQMPRSWPMRAIVRPKATRRGTLKPRLARRSLRSPRSSLSPTRPRSRWPLKPTPRLRMSRRWTRTRR
ncbi:Prolipoprotein diacylglyceryl transferase [Mycobacterium talmoniae]|uniref:Phosphatidylglycerol--prolipoprotein diacylglyceryl transferase n=1 Tax=Mycobacterium talmoniae TaxID=1858794 RepID=A0A2S8BPH0_9MYCO|nr:Prolipoprotein diacylglyceryl transferase [Mycobacterium talmoniae]